MDFKRYCVVMRCIFMSAEELEKQTSFSTMIRITQQYGKRHDVTAREIIEVLDMNPSYHLINAISRNDE